MDALKKEIESSPDDCQWERAKRLGVSQPTIHYALKRINISFKKTQKHPKADENARADFQCRIESYKKPGRDIVYLDESGFAQCMPRSHGYSKKGFLCYGVHD